MPTSPTLVEALSYAAQLHREQMRKGTNTPYVTHLLAVAGIVGDYGGDEEQIIAALLHDGPEDHGGQPILDHIRANFGDRVADIVEACTDTLQTDNKPPWRARKEAYIAHLKTISPDARLVSCADKLHNARSIVRDLRQMGPAATWGRFRGGREGTLWYYRSLAEEFRQRGPEALALELNRAVSVMESLDRASLET
jgi:(p)ppGpp synthase/HD superfamily hydrolase